MVVVSGIAGVCAGIPVCNTLSHDGLSGLEPCVEESTMALRRLILPAVLALVGCYSTHAFVPTSPLAATRCARL